MKFILGVFITVMVFLYSRPNQACRPTVVPPPPYPAPPPEPTTTTTTTTASQETTRLEGTQPPTRRTRKPTPITTQLPPQETPPPPGCSDIPPADSKDDSAPLYGTITLDEICNYIVVLHDDVAPEEMIIRIRNLTSSNGTASSPMTALNSSYGIKAVLSEFDYEQLTMVRKLEGVRYVEKDGLVNLTANTLVWSLDRIDQRRWGSPYEFMYSPNGNGMGSTVYVLDTGVNTNHVNFGGRAENWHEVVKVPGKPEDCNGHGTHVAGTVGSLTYGVATAVKIRSVRVFGCGDTTPISAIVKGINFVRDRAEKTRAVVSMSLGAPKSVVLDEATTNLINAGFVVVVSAGNEDINVCERSPARVPKAITVGATDIADSRARFSNFGAGLNIFAPGVEVQSLSYTSNIATRYLSGTSMAAPHVSGVAAILLSLGTPAKDVPQKIYDTSTKNVVGDPKGSNNRLLYVD